MSADAIQEFFKAQFKLLEESVTEAVLKKLQKQLDRPYTVKEASKELNIPESTLYHQIKANLIETSPKLGSGIRIPSSEVNRLKGLKEI